MYLFRSVKCTFHVLDEVHRWRKLTPRLSRPSSKDWRLIHSLHYILVCFGMFMRHLSQQLAKAGTGNYLCWMFIVWWVRVHLYPVESVQHKIQVVTNWSLADLERACPVHAPQGVRFFRFDIQNFQNVTASGVHAPLWGQCPPPYGKSWIRHCW